MPEEHSRQQVQRYIQLQQIGFTYNIDQFADSLRFSLWLILRLVLYYSERFGSFKDFSYYLTR